VHAEKHTVKVQSLPFGGTLLGLFVRGAFTFLPLSSASNLLPCELHRKLLDDLFKDLVLYAEASRTFLSKSAGVLQSQVSQKWGLNNSR
jgi:hypothetical protein